MYECSKLTNGDECMKQILLSVIVPIYNVKDYVEKCIESICNQTYQSLEIILVDDGSTDGSGIICDIIAQRDTRVRVIHKRNGGLVSARKAGAAIAKGEYIIAVDGDDWIEKYRFQNLVETGLINMPDMVYMIGHYKEYADNSVLVSTDVPDCSYNGERIKTELMELFYGKNQIYFTRDMEFGQWLWCVRRDIYCRNIVTINEKIVMAEDFITIFSCILESESIVCIHEPSYHYVQRNGSINYRISEWNTDHANIFFRQIKRILEKNISNVQVTDVAVHYTYHNLLLTNYKLLYDYYGSEYLFPYNSVKKGSRIVVYGAGNIGVEIINAIEENPQYEIVAWVDKTKRKNPRSVHMVEDVSVIKDRVFDFIIVAILLANISKCVKNDLIEKGIQADRIILMQSVNMNMKDLEKILG